MLVVVADDEPDQLDIVDAWFQSAFGKDKSLQLATCSKLDELEQVIESNLSSGDKLLLLLDLNWKEGQSLGWIQRIKRATATRHWPVIVYSESNKRDDVLAAHKHLANGYVCKDGTGGQEQHFVRVLEHWRQNQLLPQE